MYSFSGRVRYSECDEKKHLTVSSLLDYFQDCSTFQAESLGTGLDYVDAHRACWIVLFWQIQIERLPRFNETITTATWPYRFDKLFGCRNFKMEDEAGALLACASSVWVYYDMEKGRPVRIPQEMIKVYEHEIDPALPLPEVPRKIVLPEELAAGEPFAVHPSDIDTNHHVNNGRYVRYALTQLPEGFPVRELRVEYVRAALLGDVITPFVSASDTEAVVKLAAADGTPYANVQFFSGTL